MTSKFQFSVASFILVAAVGLCTSCGSKPAEQQQQKPLKPMSCGVEVDVNASIQHYDGEIPSNAEVLQHDMDWVVYKQDVEETTCYTACRLYLENDISHDKYILLETKGIITPGTKLAIKSRNKLAYGYDWVGYKDEATYEDGYIQSVEYVIVLTPTKLLLEGSPDCRNMYSYILDLETFSAVHVEAYSGFDGMVYENGKDYLDFFSPDYSVGSRQEYVERYDLDGNLIHREPYIDEEEL